MLFPKLLVTLYPFLHSVLKGIVCYCLYSNEDHVFKLKLLVHVICSHVIVVMFSRIVMQLYKYFFVMTLYKTFVCKSVYKSKNICIEITF